MSQNGYSLNHVDLKNGGINLSPYLIFGRTSLVIDRVRKQRQGKIDIVGPYHKEEMKNGKKRKRGKKKKYI